MSSKDNADWPIYTCYLPLRPFDVRASASMEAQKSGRTIEILARLDGRKDLRIGGRSLDVQWGITIVDNPEYNEWAAHRNAIGTIWHANKYETEDDYEPEACYGGIGVTAELFDFLLSHIIRQPNFTLLLNVKGLTFGYELDGSGVDWDTKKYPNLLINDVRAQSTVIAPIEEIESSEEPAVHDTVAPITPTRGAPSPTLGWTNLLLAAIFLVLLLR